jgi:hypothetical protein
VQLVLPELSAPATLVFDPENPLDDDAYFAFCAANPDVRIERTAKGEIVIAPPAGSCPQSLGRNCVSFPEPPPIS